MPETGHYPIYVVDDDVMFSESLTFLLRSAGFRALQPMTGEDLVRRMAELEPGCVLVDLRMPGVDGFGVIAALESRAADFPTIVITGHGDQASAVRATRLGALEFLEKPVAEAALLAAIAAAAAHLPPGARPARPTEGAGDRP